MGYEFDGVVYERLRDMQAARRARYVQLLESGMNFTQAALAVDVSKRTGKVWRNGRTRSSGRDERPLVDWYAGRMKANSGHGPASGSTCYLSEDERIEIADLLQAGESVRAIARRLGRSPSTISHELRRNAYPDDGGYRPRRAHQLASERRARPKERKIRKGTKLYDYVAAGLKRHWSPEQIGRRMLLDFPDNEDMRACHETIYVQGKGELRRDLARALCKGRATRYTILLALPDGHDAEHVQQAIIAKMKTLPKPLLSTLTWDQGSELAWHRDITASLDMQVSISATRTAPGSVAPMRTPTDCSDNTSPKEPTFPHTARTTSMQWPTSSTTGHAKPSTGPNPANTSSNCSTPCNTLNETYNHNDVLRRSLESAFSPPRMWGGAKPSMGRNPISEIYCSATNSIMHPAARRE